MKTYLIPVDFSTASANAAEYAAALSHLTLVDRIVLLNAFYVSIYETTLPSPDMIMLSEDDIEQDAADRIKKLKLLKHKLSEKVRPGVEITIHLNRSHLLRAVVENVASQQADLVILGSRGNTSDEDTQIGSHVIKIAKACPVPIIVVPPNYSFKQIHKVAVAVDFSKVKETAPIEALHRLLTHKKAELMVINTDTRNKGIDPQKAAEETAIYSTLQQYKPQYFNLQERDVITGILKFAIDNDAQLVISLPNKYSFFQSIVYTSISYQLAESSAVPVLLLK